MLFFKTIYLIFYLCTALWRAGPLESLQNYLINFKENHLQINPFSYFYFKIFVVIDFHSYDVIC